MIMNVFRSAVIASLMFATGCASTIGNRADLSEVTFQIGSTHRNQVSNTLGFPQNRVVVDGIEYWGYRDKPELTGVIYAVPTGANTVTTYQATRIRTSPLQMDSVDVIYAFDSNGTLVDVHDPIDE